MGTLLAFAMYKVVTLVEYQTINPGQDFDDHEAALFKPPEDAAFAVEVERPNVTEVAVQQALRRVTSFPMDGSSDEHRSQSVSHTLTRDDHSLHTATSSGNGKTLHDMENEHTEKTDHVPHVSS